jgi:formate/nitrite transporter FocA (FNT family)
VKSVKFAPKKGLSATLGVVFPIVVFAFCGFDHSVANMMYFFYLGEVSWRAVGYILITILGNIIGGTALPCVSLLKEKAEKEKKRLKTLHGKRLFSASFSFCFFPSHSLPNARKSFSLKFHAVCANVSANASVAEN